MWNAPNPGAFFEIVPWKFLSLQLLLCKPVLQLMSHVTKTSLVVKETPEHA